MIRTGFQEVAGESGLAEPRETGRWTIAVL